MKMWRLEDVIRESNGRLCSKKMIEEKFGKKHEWDYLTEADTVEDLLKLSSCSSHHLFMRYMYMRLLEHAMKIVKRVLER